MFNFPIAPAVLPAHPRNECNPGHAKHLFFPWQGWDECFFCKIPMTHIYRHWKPIRRIAISMAMLSILALAFKVADSGGNWLFAIFPSFSWVLFFAFTYMWPFLGRGIAEINHRLFNSMDPKSTWMQVALLWFSMIGILLQFVSLAFPLNDVTDGHAVQFAVGLCAYLGLFVGSGTFLVRERNQAEDGGGNAAAPRVSP